MSSAAERRRELENELGKLDSERREVETRIRTMERDPRNRPPRRAGDRVTRRPDQEFRRPSAMRYTPNKDRIRAREEQDGDSADRKRAKLSNDGEKDGEDTEKKSEENAEKDKEDDKEDDKDGDKGDKDDKDEDKDDQVEDKKEKNKPSVSSAVVVKGDADSDEGEKEEKEEKPKPKDQAIVRRHKRFFGGLLGHLNSASKRLKKDRTTDFAKKKEIVEERVVKKITTTQESVRENTFKEMKKKRKVDLKKREELIRAQEAKRLELLELTLVEHMESMSHCIQTKTTPPVFWAPKSHTDKTKKLLERSVSDRSRRASKGLVTEKEKDAEWVEGLIEEIRQREKEKNERLFGGRMNESDDDGDDKEDEDKKDAKSDDDQKEKGKDEKDEEDKDEDKKVDDKSDKEGDKSDKDDDKSDKDDDKSDKDDDKSDKGEKDSDK